jgi:hypothetical protein
MRACDILARLGLTYSHGLVLGEELGICCPRWLGSSVLACKLLI